MSENERRYWDEGNLPPDFPVQALGHTQGTYYFLDASGQFTEIGIETMSARMIASLVGGNLTILDKYWPALSGRDGFYTQAVVSSLIRACHTQGIIDPDRLKANIEKAGGGHE